MNTASSPGSRKPSSFWWTKWSSFSAARDRSFPKNLSRRRNNKSFAFALVVPRKRRLSEEDMKNSLSRKFRALVLFVVCGIAVSLAQGTAVANKKEILTKARQASYSLRDRGLLEFQATVTPNWRLVLQEQFVKDPASAETALKLLNGIHFTVVLDPAGVVKVTHHTAVAAPNKPPACDFAHMYAAI